MPTGVLEGYTINYIAAFLVFLAALSFFFGGARRMWRDLTRITSKLRQRFGRRSTSSLGISNVGLQISATALTQQKALKERGLFLSKSKLFTTLRRYLNRAGFDKLSLLEAGAILLALAALSGVVMATFFTSMMGAVGAIATVGLVHLYITHRQDHLTEVYDEQSRDFMLLLIPLIKRKSPETALSIAARATDAPLGRHLQEAAGALDTQMDLVDVLWELRDRAPTPGIALFVDAITAYRVDGADPAGLPAVLKDIADKLKDGMAFRRRLRAECARAIWICRVFSLIPIGFILYYRVTALVMYQSLVETTIGHILLIIGALWLVGVNMMVERQGRMKGLL